MCNLIFHRIGKKEITFHKQSCRHCFVGACIIFISHCAMHVKGWNWLGVLIWNLEYKQRAAALKCLFILRELVGDVNRILTLSEFFQHQVLTWGLYDIHTSYLWYPFRHKLLNLPQGNICQQAACWYVCVFHEVIWLFSQQIQMISVPSFEKMTSAGLSFM